MNNVAVIFDTNAYRILLYDNDGKLRETGEVKALFTRIREKQTEVQIKSYCNPFVLLELLAHIASQTDTSYWACKRAIVGAVEHCTSIDGLSLIENSESNLCLLLFGRIADEDKQSTEVIMKIAGSIYADDSDENIERFKASLVEIANSVDAIEKQFVDDMKTYVVDAVGNCEADWQLFKGDSLSQNEFLKHVRSDDFYTEWAKGQVIKSANALNIKSIYEPEMKVKIEIIKEMFKAPFAIYREILERLAGSGYNLLKDKRENSVWDMSIMFSCAANARLNGQQPVLVTNDRMMANAAKAVGLEHLCMSVDNYLTEIKMPDILEE